MELGVRISRVGVAEQQHSFKPRQYYKHRTPFEPSNQVSSRVWYFKGLKISVIVIDYISLSDILFYVRFRQTLYQS